LRAIPLGAYSKAQKSAKFSERDHTRRGET
jgi:hypothetical protein